VAHAGHGRRLTLRIREQVHLMAEVGESVDHGLDGQRSAPDLEERLGREEEDAQGRGQWWARNRSASIAAMQPLPAAVTAWR